MFKERRVHPITMLNEFLKKAKAFFLYALIIIIGQSRSEGEVHFGGYFLYSAIILIVLYIVYIFLNWFFFKYSFEDGILHIKSGIFIKKERYIKRERVQTINFKAGILFRIFNLVTLEIETAGGFLEPEVHIYAINKEYAETIKKELTKIDDVTVCDEFKEVKKTQNDVRKSSNWKISNKRIILAGMTSEGIGFIFSVLAFLFSQGTQIIPETVLDNALEFLSELSVSIIAFFIIIIFLISWMISIIIVFIRYGEFVVSNDNDEIQLSRGIVEKKKLSFKRHRIQAVKIIESPIRQMLGYGCIEVVVAGGINSEKDKKTIIHPMIKKEEIKKFLEFISPDRIYETEYCPLPKRALKRYIIRGVAPFLLIPIINLILMSYFDIGNWIWLNLTLLVLGVFLGYIRYKDGGYKIISNNIIIRNRLFSRKTILIKKKQMQNLSLDANIIQRLNSLTTFKTTVLSPMICESYTLKDIDFSNGHKIWSWFSNG
ncbi:PH domain-containing protein [Herbivorax sp. ANBcel31]|uniref:PH domain-containing protein n=1 Tax=Herbivorax sp. ANBcel31 TaxID=3069754 RepID=UPI0027B0FF68|nr:PH domain-containing protein [Herbivorax sp. ANBcel31]MDQ2085386.1 PH domain-containing protein [Herbivorax sp. ANBcel31]